MIDNFKTLNEIQQNHIFEKKDYLNFEILVKEIKQYFFSNQALSFQQLFPLQTETKYPKRIFILRHGESEANANESIYLSKPDHLHELSNKGKIQSFQIGQQLKQIIQSEMVYFYVSSYKRTIQTFKKISKSFLKQQYQVIYDKRIREQERGNPNTQQQNQQIEIEKRKQMGSLKYRFKGGESGYDVIYRIKSFISDLKTNLMNQKDPWQNCERNIVIVTHGYSLRCLLKVILELDDQQFNQIKNPSNCETFILDKKEGYNYMIQDQIQPVI